MNFMVRPSKSFLFDCLESALRQASGKIGIDAGSANFKNRRMFKTEKYVALDYDISLLRQGLQKYSDQNTVAILADLKDLSKLTPNSADVVVSTNTFHHIADDSPAAANSLCRITSSAGILMCEMPFDHRTPEVLKIFFTNFDQIKIRYFRNSISRLYEGLFERDGYLGSHPVAGTRPFRLLAWLISRLEYLTCYFRPGNHSVFIVCTHKKNGSKQEFDFSALKRLETRLYDAM